MLIKNSDGFPFIFVGIYLINLVVGSFNYFFSPGEVDSSWRRTGAVKEPSELEPRVMADSLQTAVIPLSDASFREKYVNFHNVVR